LKSSPEAVRGSRKAKGGKSTETIDESATGSVNLFFRMSEVAARRLFYCGGKLLPTSASFMLFRLRLRPATQGGNDDE
jgi:hypothetical protein